MHRLLSALLFCFALLCVESVGQTPAPALHGNKTHPDVPDRNDPYKDEALVWEKLDTTVRMRADGTGERTVHIVVRLQSEGAARQLSLVSVAYAATYQTGTIDFIRVRHPDGTTVETPTEDSIEMPAAVTREAPMYSDLKEKQLPVRTIAAGDVLDYQMHTETMKAEAPGEFWGAEHFLVEAGVVLEQSLTLEVPAAKYVQVWDPKHPAKPVEHDGLLTYTWSTAQLKPTPAAKEAATEPLKAAGPQSAEKVDDTIKDLDKDAEGRYLPSVAWTTFHSWAELGEWYRGLELERSTPTPAITARAADLTRDAKTPEEQVRAFYNFVASKTRYVGIDFGVAHYQPHPADQVLDHAYGDCKDKDTLLEALLRAKGFKSSPALIGVNIALVPDLPSPASFNHVITTVELPSGQIWLDTTPEAAPFRVLLPQIRDEQALVVPATGTATLERTPADPPFAYFERFEATGTLDKDGLLKTHNNLVLRSDNELGFRLLIERAAPAQWDQAMQSVSNGIGFSGTVTGTDFKQVDPLGPVRIRYDYSRASFADWEHLRILPLFPVLEVPVIDKPKAPEQDIDQGAPRTLEAVTRLQLPEGYRAELPDAMHVQRAYATFDKTYRLEKGELVMERKVVILKKKVPKADWKDYTAYVKACGLEDGENYVVLLAPAMTLPAVELPSKGDAAAGKKADAKPAGSASTQESGSSTKPELSDADLAAAINDARQLENARDWSGATQKLQQIRSVRRDYPYVMSMLGYIAQQQGKPDEAIEDYQAELKNHPDANASIVLLLATAYSSRKRSDDAIALLTSYSNRNNVQIAYMLASLQTKAGDDTAALATLQASAAANPTLPGIQTAVAEKLLVLHRTPEAAATAKAAMEGSDDASVLNSGAYILAEAGTDLALAEKNSRRSLDLLESASAKVGVAEANSKTFAQSQLLAASWDTLGWILYCENKPAEAESYLAAAWFDRQDAVVGKHLAQVREALGKKTEALTIDDLALASAAATADKSATADLKRNGERLHKAGVKSAAGNAVQTLQNMRTFHIEKPKGVAGSGTFRVQLAGDGIRESELVAGDEQIRPLTAKLNALKIPGVTPTGSAGRLVRDGVMNCSALLDTCEFVLMPQSGLAMEGIPRAQVAKE